MADMTTEQVTPFTLGAVDGRGRVVAIDGTPVGVSSDETVATVKLTPGGDNKTWNGEIVASGVAGTCRVVVTADADISANVSEVIGTADVNVTLDPRTAARMAKFDLGPPVDKPV